MANRRGRLIWRGALLVVACMILGAAAGLLLAFRPVLAVSSSQLLIVGSGSWDTSGDGVLRRNEYVNQRMPTYPVLATSDITVDAAATALGISPADLMGSITATAVPETTVITIDVSAPTPEEARARNTAVVDALSKAITETENLPTQPERVNLVVVSPPSLPAVGQPRIPLYPVAGALGGGLAVVAIWAMIAWRRRESSWGGPTDDEPRAAEGDSAAGPAEPPTAEPPTAQHLPAQYPPAQYPPAPYRPAPYRPAQYGPIPYPPIPYPPIHNLQMPYRPARPPSNGYSSVRAPESDESDTEVQKVVEPSDPTEQLAVTPVASGADEPPVGEPLQADPGDPPTDQGTDSPVDVEPASARANPVEDPVGTRRRGHS